LRASVVSVAGRERASTQPGSSGPVWTVVEAAIEDSQIDAGLDEPTAAAHTLGPILYQCLFNNTPITRTDIERTADAFLAAFAT
jgi:hypothetical protein